MKVLCKYAMALALISLLCSYYEPRVIRLLQGRDQILVGDWDGDGRDNLAVRRGITVLMDTNFDEKHDRDQSYGDPGDQMLVGDWDGDGKDNLAVRRDIHVLMDFNFDGKHDKEQNYGVTGDQILVGDWDGDRKDNLAVRRDLHVLMDFNFDGQDDKTQNYGVTGDQMLVGDWDGDGKDNLAVRRDIHVLMDFNFDGVADKTQSYGNPGEEMLVGDWDGDGKDNLAVRRGISVLMDTNFDNVADIVQNFGNDVVIQAEKSLWDELGKFFSSIRWDIGETAKDSKETYKYSIAFNNEKDSPRYIYSQDKRLGSCLDDLFLGEILPKSKKQINLDSPHPISFIIKDTKIKDCSSSHEVERLFTCTGAQNTKCVMTHIIKK